MADRDRTLQSRRESANGKPRMTLVESWNSAAEEIEQESRQQQQVFLASPRALCDCLIQKPKLSSPELREIDAAWQESQAQLQALEHAALTPLPAQTDADVARMLAPELEISGDAPKPALGALLNALLHSTATADSGEGLEAMGARGDTLYACFVTVRCSVSSSAGMSGASSPVGCSCDQRAARSECPTDHGSCLLLCPALGATAHPGVMQRAPRQRMVRCVERVTANLPLSKAEQLNLPHKPRERRTGWRGPRHKLKRQRGPTETLRDRWRRRGE